MTVCTKCTNAAFETIGMDAESDMRTGKLSDYLHGDLLNNNSAGFNINKLEYKCT